MESQTLLAAALDAQDWGTAAMALALVAGSRLPPVVRRDLFRIGCAASLSALDIRKVQTVAAHVAR